MCHREQSSASQSSNSAMENDSIRRDLFGALAALLSSTALPGTTTAAAATLSSSYAPTETSMSPDQATITQKVFFNVRISRSDGTFYVRDDLSDAPENQVFAGRITMGLFGKNAPNHVSRFLQYVATATATTDTAAAAAAAAVDTDNTAAFPSYSRSTFPQFDQATGLLYSGYIPSLEVTEFQGTSVLKYGGRLLPSKLWIDTTTTTPKISHSSIGLLTHQQLNVTPVFGITTRSDTRQLDRTHTVFGKVIMDETATAFLKRVAELPTYSIDRPVDSATTTTTTTATVNPVLDEAATAIFAAQRDFFRGAAKSFGDTRVSKLYGGKLLRRVEVTQVGLV